MKMKERSPADRYIEAVSKGLTSPRKFTNSYIAHLRADVTDFVSDDPALTYDDIIAEFGDPEIAASGIEDMIPKGPASVKAKNRSRVYYIIMIVMAILTIVFIVGYFLSLNDMSGWLYSEMTQGYPVEAFTP